MRNRNSKGMGYLLLILLTGAIIGGIAGDILGNYLAAFEPDWVIGMTKPVELDLYLIKLTLGLTLRLNLGSIIGMLLSLIGYMR